MKFKRSAREKMLRRIAWSVYDSCTFNMGVGLPDNFEALLADRDEMLTFLEKEIWWDRLSNGATERQLKFKL